MAESPGPPTKRQKIEGSDEDLFHPEGPGFGDDFNDFPSNGDDDEYNNDAASLVSGDHDQDIDEDDDADV